MNLMQVKRTYPGFRLSEHHGPRVILSCLLIAMTGHVTAAKLPIHGPEGSGRFGRDVLALPNGNVVVVDPLFDLPPPNSVADVGAVHLYRSDGTHISSLVGSSAGDRVGSLGIVPLQGGNFVIVSPDWNGNRGAVTWVDADEGLSGSVAMANSLVGSAPGDAVGLFGATALSNGNYVVASAFWNQARGAATWGDGDTGITGELSAQNSLVGSAPGNFVAESTVALDNGNFVVASPLWDRADGVQDVGAVTWCSGEAGCQGEIDGNNSLVGRTANDQIASDTVIPLRNGHYVVVSSSWDAGSVLDATAITWGNGAGGTHGPVDNGNSLFGINSTDLDNANVVPLANGHYVVVSPYWQNGTKLQAGAATWATGTAPSSGPISSANSLVGTHGGAGQQLKVLPLTNGHFVVSFPWFSSGSADVGAVTWCNGTRNTSDVVSSANSLVGSFTDDRIGLGRYGVTALANGNYVVSTVDWDNGASNNAGAVTWRDGSRPHPGVVDAGNSVVGATVGDRVGEFVTPLTNGHYVIGSPLWNDVEGPTPIANAGAATWADGRMAAAGLVSRQNSVVGQAGDDRVSESYRGGVLPLAGGDYVVLSEFQALWGGATRRDGWANDPARVSDENSLVAPPGSRNWLGYTLEDGGFLLWNWGVDCSATVLDCGNISLWQGDDRPTGALLLDSSNSVTGRSMNSGNAMTWSYEASRGLLAVGDPLNNVVTVLAPATPNVFSDGFE